jgi:hypothetical protein
MSDLRTAAQQALEALEIGYACAEAEAAQYHAAMAGYRPHRHAQMDADVQKIAQAITALKAAMAQPEQEPVAWIHRKHYLLGHAENMPPADKALAQGWTPLYTNPPRRETEQEPVADAMKTVIKAMQDDPDYAWSWHCNVAMAFFDAGGDSYTANQGAARFMRLLANVDPAHELPSHQPRREWRGLTDEEISDIFEAESRYHYPPICATDREFARAVEAALKERNA